MPGGQVLYAAGAYAVGLSGMTLSFRAAAPGVPPGFPGVVSSAWVPPFAVASFPRPRRRRNPLPRVSRAPGCARYAAARFARLIAPAREADARRGLPKAGAAASCHGMSCFVCGWRICCGLFRHEAVLPGRSAGGSVRFARRRVFGMGSSFRSRFVPSAPPAAEPFAARIARACACAWPRALRGGAVRAPDCACAREADARRTFPVGFPKVFFRAGASAKQEAKRPRADAASFLPTHPSADFRKSSHGVK